MGDNDHSAGRLGCAAHRVRQQPEGDAMADERRLPADPEIVAYATQGAFFTIYDCLDIGKVKVEVATYERGQGQTARAVAYLDAADLRPLVYALKSGQFEALFAGRFESFGGSQRQGSVESRILRLEHDPGEGGRFSRFPLRLTVTNGPGKLTPTGAITPAGEPAARVSIRFPLLDLLRLLLEVEAYLDAYLAANVERLRSERAATLAEKLAARHNGEGAPDVTQRSPAPDERAAAPVAPREPEALLSQAQRGYLIGLAKRYGIDLDAYLARPLDSLTKAQATRAIAALKAGPEPPATDWAAEIRRLGADKFGWNAAQSEAAAARKAGKPFAELTPDELQAIALAMDRAPVKKAA